MVVDTLAMSCQIFGYFKYSILAYHLLDEIRGRLDMVRHNLQQVEPIQGNYTLFMLELVFEQKWRLLLMQQNMEAS